MVLRVGETNLIYTFKKYYKKLNMKKYLILGIALATTVACKNNKVENNADATDAQTEVVTTEDNAQKELVVNLEPKNDATVNGVVTFTEKDGVVHMNFKGSGFEPGEHAIHIHEKADCSSPDGKSAGGHWNPTSEDHGKWGTSPYHKGDIGNFTADANGNVLFDFETDEWCIGCDDETKNIVGKSIIIHDGVDDFVSQPAGNAGSRISCGAIIE